MGQFMAKRKGCNLLFGPKVGIFNMGQFVAKSKGYSLACWPKGGDIPYGPICGEKQRL